ncbi:GTPase-activating protein gyp7-like isoform X1 [Olea europaea var. sylvestris]|uniref:GTPase-activating protein gyp7-like isoform X1 n=2 Tax=Olea europaea var. sylvestris TaxID=158386 RepID=UPI000C1D4553|nr:GTPase-activating protein gyp7-like isoform X1 [Olea europaea var. sylvestris]
MCRKKFTMHPTLGSHKSPWSRRRRKHALLAKQWKSLFDAEGKLSDGGIRLLKKARSGGVEPSIRAEVWPFLLGLYDLKSTQNERDAIGAQKRREYLDLRRQCQQNLKCSDRNFKSEIYGNNINESGEFNRGPDSPVLEEVASARASLSVEGVSLEGKIPTISGHILHLKTSSTLLEEKDGCGIIDENISEEETESSDSDSSEESDDMKPLLGSTELEDNEIIESTSYKMETRSTSYMAEDFASWQRIMRVDAVRANSEWIVYSPSEASVSEVKACRLAESVGLKDYDHLEPCMIYHAARLIAILEAYALYDPETGYCQGMSDLLSPIISVISDDHVAFWCFVGFMRKARHNFRLDEMGIRRQLKIVSKIIKGKDSHLYKHLEKLQAEDCFFVYRMVVVLFRRELTFEQTLCLWEVMWADQAAIRAGIGRSTWGRMRLRAPPTDDLLLYAIAASVLQKRKLIVEKYSSMDEIMRECNGMTGHLDVWKLLDDAHDLVVTLHDKI